MEPRKGRSGTMVSGMQGQPSVQPSQPSVQQRTLEDIDFDQVTEYSGRWRSGTLSSDQVICRLGPVVVEHAMDETTQDRLELVNSSQQAGHRGGGDDTARERLVETGLTSSVTGMPARPRGGEDDEYLEHGRVETPVEKAGRPMWISKTSQTNSLGMQTRGHAARR